MDESLNEMIRATTGEPNREHRTEAYSLSSVARRLALRMICHVCQLHSPTLDDVMRNEFVEEMNSANHHKLPLEMRERDTGGVAVNGVAVERNRGEISGAGSEGLDVNATTQQSAPDGENRSYAWSTMLRALRESPIASASEMRVEQFRGRSTQVEQFRSANLHMQVEGDVVDESRCGDGLRVCIGSSPTTSRHAWSKVCLC